MKNVYVIVDKNGEIVGMGKKEDAAWGNSQPSYDNTAFSTWKDAMMYRGWKCIVYQPVPTPKTSKTPKT